MNDICVIMCVWQRVDKLSQTIEMLNQQKYKDFDFYIWNNNSDKSVIKHLSDLNEKHKIISGIKQSKTNVGGIGRFIYSSELNHIYPKIIFIDDDQIFGPNLILEMSEKFKPNSIISWWGWKINSMDYFDRFRVKNFNEVDYCGTGGMIIDSKIFNESLIFKIPEKYKFIEDLWLSFIAKKFLNYKLYGYEFDLKIIEDGKDQSLKLLNIKREMFLYLNNLNIKTF